MTSTATARLKILLALQFLYITADASDLETTKLNISPQQQQQQQQSVQSTQTAVNEKLSNTNENPRPKLDHNNNRETSVQQPPSKRSKNDNQKLHRLASENSNYSKLNQYKTGTNPKDTDSSKNSDVEDDKSTTIVIVVLCIVQTVVLLAIGLVLFLLLNGFYKKNTKANEQLSNEIQSYDATLEMIAERQLEQMRETGDPMARKVSPGVMVNQWRTAGANRLRKRTVDDTDRSSRSSRPKQLRK